MAVAKVKKAFIISHHSIKNSFLKELQESGFLQVINLREKLEEEREEVPLEELRSLNLTFSKVQFIHDFLKNFEEKKKGLLASLIKEKFKVTWDEFEKIEEKIDFNKIYQECELLDFNLTHLSNQINYLKASRENLLPWITLKLKLAEIKETKRVGIILGVLPSASLSAFQQELEETFPDSSLGVINEEPQNTYILLFYYKEIYNDLAPLMAKYGLRLVSFPHFEQTPQEEILKIEEKIEKLEQEKEKLIAKARNLLYLKKDIIVLQEYINSRIKRLEVESNFARTKETFMLEGWVLEENENALRQMMEKYSHEVDLTLLEPAEDEKPPIFLKNSPIIQPFETLTRLFGMPDYRELDPTPYLAPFFFLFFGICLGDVGYGVLLTMACWWMAKKLEVSENVKRGLLLFAYGGIASIIVGVLTGSYFGLDAKYLPAFLKRAVIIWPLDNLTTFLLMTIALGIIQVSFGIILAAVNNIRNGQFSKAIYDQVTTILFLWAALSTLTLALTEVMVRVTPPWVESIFSPSLKALGATMLGIVFFHGRYFNRFFESFGNLFELIKKKELMEGAKKLIAFIVSTLFTFSVIGWVVTFFTFKNIHPNLGKLILVSFLLAFLFKPSRQLLVSFFSGLYSLYNMSRYIGNILSYVRLLALGLATGLIAGALNLLVEIFIQQTGFHNYIFSIKGVVVLLMFLVLLSIIIFFHLIINLGMGLIGCFVHPARLQFVEFFSQFYFDGGRKFEPFAIQTKHLVFKE